LLLSILKRPAWLGACRMITGRRMPRFVMGLEAVCWRNVAVEHRILRRTTREGFWILILSPAAKTLSWSHGRRVRMTIGWLAGASLTARCSTQLWLTRLGSDRMH